MEKFYKYYKDLPPIAKGAVVIGGIGILYFVGLPIYRKVFPTDAQKNANAILNNADADIKKFLQAGQKPTFADSQYIGFSDVIYNAQRTSLGNESSPIKDTLLKMKNNIDVAKLIKAYGVRQNYAFGFPTENFGLLGAAYNGITKDMFGLYSGRVEDINKDWAKKGITYKI
jgi:hypothetical protein